MTKFVARINLIIGVLIFLFLHFFGNLAIDIFLNKDSSRVMSMAQSGLRIFSFVFLVNGLNILITSFFTSIGNNRVVVYADCAVNPDPTPAQLADIAISSAQTAVSFGIEQRIAMLSYSTGTSGFGADVDNVREATNLVREKAPELKVEGPIQFDAAVDEVVAAKKMPGSEVAGRATVFI